MQEPSLSSSILPEDLLLEIAARSDPVALVRCGATCKALRSQIADPAFRPRLLHADRFVPTLLRGLFIENLPRRRQTTEGQHPRFVVPGHSKEPAPEPFRSFLSKYATLFKFYHPVLAARRGLVALRSGTNSGNQPAVVGVFNPMTGYLYFFGPPGIKAQSFVLLIGADGGDGGAGHYRLLAAELSSGHLRTQTFSPVEHARLWQAIAETAVAPCPHDAALLHPPIVLQGDDTHWLCRSAEYHFVLRFSHAQLRTSVTKIQGHCGEVLRGRRSDELLLVSDGHGRKPRLLVATGLEISLWTLCDSAGEGGSWSKQVLVEPESIRRPSGQWSEQLELRWSGERSGYVSRMAGADERSRSWYFMLELATRRVRGICKAPHRDLLVFFPYEMDLSFWRPNFTRQLHQ